MGEELGTAVLTLDAESGPLNKALDLADVATQGKVSAMGDKVKGIMGNKLAAGAALGAAAIVGGVAIAGKALYDLGKSFDDAYDILQVRTGASGQQLEGLKSDFKDVVSSVPTDFTSAAEAVGQLNQRLGLTGDPLREVSKDVLELSRLTGTDLNENIESLSRLFGDWGISADQMGPHMDKLFRLSQKTGIGVSDLARSMVQFGSPLRQLGLNFDTAAVMFAKFEKEGVNVQTLMPGLRMALKNMSDPTDDMRKSFVAMGVDLEKGPSVALQQVMAAIKAAPTDLKANQMAFEVFGARAGPDMAAAIREGRFEFGDLMKEMNTGKGTIQGTAAQTNDLSENWQVFKNRVLVGLEPLATATFNGINKALIGTMAFMDQLSTKGTTAYNIFKVVTTGIAFLFGLLWNAISGFVGGTVQMLSGLFQTIQGIFDVFAGVFTGDWRRVWQGLQGIFGGIWNVLMGVMKQALWAPLALAKSALGGIGDVFRGAWQKAKDITKSLLEDAVNIVKNAISAIINVIKGAPGAVAGAARDIGQKIIDGISWVKDRAADIARSIVQAVANAISGAASLAKSAANTVIDQINSAIPNSIDLPKPAPNVNIPDNPIPHVATGARALEGGLYQLGERGVELAQMPGGSRVWNARQTEQMLEGGGNTNVGVRVFIGDTELTDLVRTEIDEHEREEDMAYGAGIAPGVVS